ncbi:MAG: hypothetical protein IJ677_05560 [Alphaproteobacteria bacterium]|nr:hypothetical protein [Alphaproteobacteria bacterium]
MNKVYYYSFKRLNLWLVFNILLVAKVIYCVLKCPTIFTYPQSYVILGCVFVSVAAWCYKYLLKHPMALVSDKSIKIDHCNPLDWKDIERTEEKVVRCWFKKMPVLILHPKKGIKYEYNFLQKHNCDFTAFSIPLYDIIAPEDRDELVKLIKQKVK